MSPNQNAATMILPTLEGVRRDRDFYDLDVSEARDALNWIRRDRRLLTRPGLQYHEPVASGGDPIGASKIGERPLAIYQYDHDDESGRIICVTTTGFYHYNKSTKVWDDKTGATALNGTASSEVVIRSMNYGGEQVIIFTNGIDVPKKWDGVTAAIEDLGGTPPECGCMAVAFNRVLLGNIIGGADPSDQAVDVSEYRNPDAGYNGTVQQQFLLDANGRIVVMESIGNRRVGIYLEDAIYVATAVGGEFPFRFDLAYKGTEGPVSARACIPTPDGHIYLARDATLRMFNGSTFQVIQRDSTDDRINAYLRDTLLFDQRSKAWLAYNAIRNELHVHYVPVGSDEVVGGFILNMSDLSLWPVRWGFEVPTGMFARIVGGPSYAEIVGVYADHPVAYSDFETQVTKMMFQDAEGQMCSFDGALDGTTEISHYIETGLRPAGDPRQAAVIRYANHLLEPTASGQEVSVQFGASQFGEDRVLEAAKTVDLALVGRARRETHHRLRGTMFSMRLSGTTSGAQVEWRGSQVVADPVGD